MHLTVSKKISYFLAVLAIAASAILLATDVSLWNPPVGSSGPISSAPLLLAGFSFLAIQALLRPSFPDLVKNVLLAATFLLWGVVLLLPQTETVKRLGDLVIVLYVLDLAWTILATKNSAGSRAETEKR